MYLASILFLLLITFFQSVIFAADACSLRQRNNSIEKMATTLNEGLANAKTYFEQACQIDKKTDPAYAIVVRESLKNTPPTQSLRTSIPEVDQAGNRLQDFLSSVLARIKARHAENLELATQIHSCTSSNRFSNQKSCVGLSNWLQTQLPDITKLARFNLAMAHHTDHTAFFPSKSELQMNSSLDEKKSFKSLPWQALTNDERTVFQKSFAKMEQDVLEMTTAEIPKSSSQKEKSKAYVQNLLKVRHTHYMIYLSLLGINPILQYIKSPNPTASEIHSAATEILKNLSEEKKQLLQIESSLAHPHSVGRVGMKDYDDRVLTLLDYRTEVEEVLLEKPQFCGLGTALHQIKANKQYSAVIAGLPVLAISFFVPPMYGLAIGTTSSAYYVYDSQKTFRDNVTRENARIQREGMSAFAETILPDDNTHTHKTSDEIRDEIQKDVTRVYRANLQTLKQSESDRDVSVVLTPAFIVAPVVPKYLTVFKNSLHRAARTTK